MKCIALCLVLVASVACTEIHHHGLGLDEIVQGFVDRFPVAEIKEWAHDKYHNDADFQELAWYLRSRHFQKIGKHIHKHKWMKAFIEYLEDNGIPPQSQNQDLLSLFGLPPQNPKFNAMGELGELGQVGDPHVHWELRHLAEEAAEIIKPHLAELAAYAESIKDEKKAKEFVRKIKARSCEEFAVDHVYPFRNFQQYIHILEQGNLPLHRGLWWIAEKLWGHHE